jgi:hypothetical protein
LLPRLCSLLPIFDPSAHPPHLPPLPPSLPPPPNRSDILRADEGAEYDQLVEVDLSTLEPHVNGPFTPDLAHPLSEFAAALKKNGWCATGGDGKEKGGGRRPLNTLNPLTLTPAAWPPARSPSHAASMSPALSHGRLLVPPVTTTHHIILYPPQAHRAQGGPHRQLHQQLL